MDLCLFMWVFHIFLLSSSSYFILFCVLGPIEKNLVKNNFHFSAPSSSPVLLVRGARNRPDVTYQLVMLGGGGGVSVFS